MLAAVLALACGSNGASADAGKDVTVEAASDGDTGLDAGSDASSDQDVLDVADVTDAGGYSTLNDLSKWTTFDTTTVNAFLWGFVGAAFDGRYLYLAPNGSTEGIDGLVGRYDTQSSFTATASWSTFDVTTVNGGANGFRGTAFDGRYVYFVPGAHSVNGLGVADGIIARYDTLAGFTASSSWSTFDVTTINANANGFAGAVFDGRYLYLVPAGYTIGDGGFTTPDGIVARYDTQASFTTGSSWSTFDVTTVDQKAKGFVGGVFDGQYVYLVPADYAVGGVVARYDAQSGFDATTSWTTFDTTAVDSTAKGFVGAAFDGRYVYFVPYRNGIGTTGPATRYDTQSGFTTTTSWSTFDLSMVNADVEEFAGAAFDGRYVYLVPYFHNGGAASTLARYDTQANFTNSASWSVFDMTTVNPNAKGFYGAAFDGRYVYFTSNFNNVGTTARFDAKTPPALPAGYAHGSFF